MRKKMPNRKALMFVLGPALLVAGAVLLASPFMAPGLTNTIVMERPTTVGKDDLSITANDLKPVECNGITLTLVVTDPGSGSVSGVGDNELVLGSSGTTTLNGGAGDDCIVASQSAVSPTLNGGPGNDVCIGPPSSTFDPSCEQTYTQ